ncbi:MAG: IMPACT family protein [Bacilli bacterium]
MVSVKNYYNSLIEVNGSKFIAILFPLEDEKIFKEYLEIIKKEYKKARHYVYAYRTKNASKSNDDGEPKGTAGRPILEVLYKKDLIDCAIVVIRYFGGTKLGAGRLLRTYVASASSVIEKADLIEI